MFSSYQQLQSMIPSRYCDLISLVSVAYYIVHKQMPATVFAMQKMRENPGTKLLEKKAFHQLRLENQRRFEKELCSKNNPFHKLCTYLHDKRDFSQLQEKKYLNSKDKKQNYIPL
jgi:hypothetical protein